MTASSIGQKNLGKSFMVIRWWPSGWAFALATLRIKTPDPGFKPLIFSDLYFRLPNTSFPLTDGSRLSRTSNFLYRFREHSKESKHDSKQDPVVIELGVEPDCDCVLYTFFVAMLSDLKKSMSLDAGALATCWHLQNRRSLRFLKTCHSARPCLIQT